MEETAKHDKQQRESKVSKRENSRHRKGEGRTDEPRSGGRWRPTRHQQTHGWQLGGEARREEEERSERQGGGDAGGGCSETSVDLR